MQNFTSNSSVSEKYFNLKQSTPDFKKHTMRGAGVTVLSQVSGYCIRLISTIILARQLTPNDFGQVTMIFSFLVFFLMFRNLGLYEAIIQKEEINPKQISTLFWINVAFCFVMMLIFICLAPIIAWFYDEPSLNLIAMVCSIELFIGGLSIQHLALLKRSLRFSDVSGIEIISSIISFVVSIAFALVGWGVWALVARNLTLAMSITIGAWLVCRWIPSSPVLRSGIRPMLKFGINNLGTYTINFFSQNFDKILIGWKNNAQSLAYYDRAYQLFMGPASQLTFPLHHVAVSTLSRLCNDLERYRRYYLNALSALAFVGMPIGAILTVMSNDIILLLLGPQWHNAVEIFSVFGLGIGIMLLYGTHGWLHASLGRPDRWFLWSIANALVTSLSFIIGLPFGPFGVAVAYTSSLYVLVIPCLWYAGRPAQISLLSIVSAVWKYYAAALGAGLLTWFFVFSFGVTSNVFVSVNIFYRLFLSFSLCTFVYLILLIAFYQNIKPISQFISVVYDIVPNILKK